MRDLKLPAWALHSMLSVCMAALGFMVSEIRTNTNGREAEIDRAVKIEIPLMRTEVAVLKIQVAAVEGQQLRVETKVDKLTNKIDDAIEKLTHLQSTLNRLSRE